MFLGSDKRTNEWAKRAMTYIGIKVRLVGQVSILDADRQGRIGLRFGAGTVTLGKAIRSLFDQGQNQILLNLANVNRLDADDLRELVSVWAAVKEGGGQMKVIPLTPKLAELVTDSKGRPLFDGYLGESQAVDSFGSHSVAQGKVVRRSGDLKQFEAIEGNATNESEMHDL